VGSCGRHHRVLLHPSGRSNPGLLLLPEGQLASAALRYRLLLPRRSARYGVHSWTNLAEGSDTRRRIVGGSDFWLADPKSSKEASEGAGRRAESFTSVGRVQHRIYPL